MAHRKFDLVQETSTSTGTGAMALAGAPTRRRTFGSVLSNADTCYVLIENAAAAEWEICLATYATSGNQLTRGAVLASSTGSAVSFSAGTKTISLIAPASKAIVEDNNGDASVTRRLGVGTTTPFGSMHVSGPYVNSVLTDSAGGADAKHWDFATGSDVIDLRLINDAFGAVNVAYRVARSGYAVNYQTWYMDSSTEAMRLASSGLGIGTTPIASTTAKLFMQGDIVLKNTNRAIMGNVYFDGAWKYAANGYGGGIGLAASATQAFGVFGTAANNVGGAGAAASISYLFLVDGAGHIYPGTDNGYSCGKSGARWSVVYAGTGTINTSGADSKIGIRAPLDAERRAARRILDIGPKIYQFRDAYDAKGEAARLHAGYIAEDVRDALEAEGLDPWRYGFMCADDLTRTEEYTEAVERPKVRKVEATERAVEIIDGKPVMVTRTVEREEPVGQMLPVIGQDGTPVMVPGEPDAEGNAALVPMMHFVQDTETVEETRTREVATGEKRLGLRYSELEAFLKCATAE